MSTLNVGRIVQLIYCSYFEHIVPHLLVFINIHNYLALHCNFTSMPLYLRLILACLALVSPRYHGNEKVRLPILEY